MDAFSWTPSKSEEEAWSLQLRAMLDILQRLVACAAPHAAAARGHFGNYIVVLPALDLVISHKTWPIRYESPEEYADVNVTWSEMQKIIDRLLAARK